MNPKDAMASKKQLADKVSFFPAWCKRCGNCVAFCPRQALKADEWGYPKMDCPERCTLCGLCEMLCPDFALSVGEAPCLTSEEAAAGGEPLLGAEHGPERLAPSPSDAEENRG